MTEQEVSGWYQKANIDGWPFGISSLVPNEQGYFRTGNIFAPQNELASYLSAWVIENAGVPTQHFNGFGLNKANSSVRYVEFFDAFMTFQKSGGKYNYDVMDKKVSTTMEEMARGASNLLSALRRDGHTLKVARCFVNVMDTKYNSGAGAHVDMEASMGTVVIKLSEEDTVQEALHILQPSSGPTGTPVQLPKGHGVAFLPMTKHFVPSIKRSSTRVTINFFFQSYRLHNKDP